MRKVDLIEDITADSITEDLLNATQPVVMKNFASHWPLVKAGCSSAKATADYLLKFYSGRPISACYGEPETQGRVFYNEQLDGFNFSGSQINLNQLLDKLLESLDTETPPLMYMASTEVNQWFPGLIDDNSINFGDINPLASLWLGNKSRIAAHYDFPQNIAVCIAGERRFTLFPPEQISNLYVGPMEFAPGGQDISLVDFAKPDFEKHPKFKQALDAAMVAELSPGDALLIPSLWWHHVEGLSAFNLLLTHWWRNSPAYLGRPNNALLAAMLSIRSLPPEQRRAWKHIFNHYIFDHQADDLDHIPATAHNILERPLTELSARKLRADLLNKLKR